LKIKIAAITVIIATMLPLEGAAAPGSSKETVFTDLESYAGGLILEGAERAPAGSVAKEVLSTQQDAQAYTVSGARSPAVEAGFSMLLPGLGQYRMGNRLRSKIYFGLEAAAWVTAGSFYWQSVVRRDAMEDYAVAYAGVSRTGHNKEYYEKVSDYMSSDGPYSYNEYILREARSLYFPDEEAMDSYYEENSIPQELSWRWSTEKDYLRFKRMLSGYEASQRRTLYAFFFMMGLRVVSAVDAFYLAKAPASNDAPNTGMSIEIDPIPGGMRLGLARKF
jgi:hypothetical protein